MPGWLTAPIDWWVATAPDLIGPVYIFVNAGHILSLGVLVGAVVALDLRLLGAFRATPLAQFVPPLIRLAGFGLAFALLTGVLLFSVQPAHYLENTAFRIKLALIVVGIVNSWLGRSLTRGPRGLHGSPSALLRFTAALSLVIWVSAVLAGRWIAFL